MDGWVYELMGWRGHTPKTFATTRAPAVLKSRNTNLIPDRNTTDGLFGLLLTGGYWWTWAEVQKFPNLLPAVSHTHTLLSSHLWRYHFHLLGNAFEIKGQKYEINFMKPWYQQKLRVVGLFKVQFMFHCQKFDLSGTLRSILSRWEPNTKWRAC